MEHDNHVEFLFQKEHETQRCEPFMKQSQIHKSRSPIGVRPLSLIFATLRVTIIKEIRGQNYLSLSVVGNLGQT